MADPPEVPGPGALLACRPNLEVADAASAASWFVDVLGFDVAATMGEPATFALLVRDGVDLVLVGSPQPAVPAAASCYLTVTDVGRWHQRCRDRGAEVAVPLTTQPWGMTDFVVRGPSGHLVAVGERTG